MLGVGTVAHVLMVALVLGGSAVGSGMVYGWTEVAPPSAFVTGFETNLAWDPQLGVEMVIGHDARGDARTYALEDRKWVDLGLRTPQATSVNVIGADLVFDASDHYMLLVLDFSGTLGPVLLYALGGAGWNHVPATGGPTRSVDYNPALVYDASDGYVVYYGGSTVHCDCGSNGTWSYHAGTWHRLSATPLPPFVQFPRLVYDPAIGKVLLFNDGADFVSVDFQFWTFHAGIWTHVFPAHRPRVSGSMGYDSQLNALLLTGVTESGQGPYVFLWGAGEPGFRNVTEATLHPGVDCLGPSLTSMSYDPTLGGLLCVGANSGLWLFR